MNSDDLNKSKTELIAELAALRKEVFSLRSAEDTNLTNVIRDSGDGLLVIDQNGKVLFANPAAKQILGRNRDGLIGKQFGFPTTGHEKIEIDILGLQGQTVPVELWARETVWEDAPATRISLRDLTETRAAQEALRRREYEFKAIFQQSLLFSLILDPQGTVLKMNDLCFQVCGDLAENVVGTPIWEAGFWAPSNDVRQRTRSAVQKVQNGEKVEDETIFLNKERQERIGMRIFSPVLDDDGKLLLISLVGMDISDSKQAERELIHREQILRYIIKHDPNALAVYDNNLLYIAASDRYLQDYNIEEKDIIGRHHYEVFPEIPARWRRIHQQVLQGSVETNQDDFFERPDGSITYNRWECRPWYTYEGNIGGMITYTEVTTERKIAEQKLARQKNLFETMFNAFPDGIIVTNTNREIVLANKGMETVFGHSPHELLGKSTEMLYADTENFQQAGSKVFNRQAPQTSSFYRTQYKTREGIVFPGETFGAKLYDDNGNWIGNLGIMRDITEKENRDKENQQLQRQLLQAQKMESIGTLAGGIAHDFNNILSAILGFSELAMEEMKSENPLRKDLEEIYTAGVRAKDLVKQILAFARQSDEKRQPLQISMIIKEAIKFLRSSIPTSIDIRHDIRSKSLIMGNPTQIHQVIMNLCTNAVQSMQDEKGTLQVAVDDIVLDAGATIYPDLPMGHYIQVQISDDGAGIAAEHIDLIFEPYFTTKEQGEGTGLGLSQVYGIVESYGGRISVQSTLGQGSLFTILLPIESEQPAHEIEENGEELPKGDENILVIDDEAQIAKILHKILTGLGYAVTMQTDSVKAFELFRSHPSDFDLIISDMTMPKMTGDELAAEISSIRPGIPIIICTGFSRKTSGKTPSDLHADEILIKPIVRSELAKIVRKLLNR